MSINTKQKEIDIDDLYNQYVDVMYAYALSLNFNKDTCKDAIHDVFFKVFQNSEQLSKIKNIKSYLLKSLRNRLLDIYRNNRKFTDYSPESIAVDFPFNTELTIEDKFIITEEEKYNLKKVQDILNSLTNRQREIIYFRYIEEMSYEEISDIMMISLPSCRKMVFKTIEKLRKSNLALFPLLLLALGNC